jgi:putative ABC transport system permease protein
MGMRGRALARVLKQNLSRNTKHLLFSAFGIVVGIASFVFFWGLSAGVSRVLLHDIFPIDRVEVISPKTSLTGLGSAVIDDALVAKIQARPEVKAAYPKMKMAFPATGRGKLLGNSVGFEVGGFCDGIDPILVEGDRGSDVFKDWDALDEGKRQPCGAEPDNACAQDYFCKLPERECRHRVPVLISRTLLEMYNGSFATSHGLPKIGAAQEAALMSRARSLKFTIGLGNSMISAARGLAKAPPEDFEAMIAGVSDKAMPIGVTVPIGYMKRWNERWAGPDTAKVYSSVVVVLNDKSDMETFLPWIKESGYEQEESQAERISLVITIVTALFLVIAFTICFISAVNISHTFFMMISERRREIGLLRAVGASRADIWKIILGEAAIIGIGGGALGIGIALALAKIIDVVSQKSLPDYPFKPETYFTFSPVLIVSALAFAVAFCVLGAALPARKAAAQNPAQALTS